MLHHYLLAAIRGFTSHKLYTFINVVGLSIGLACAILIALYVRDELSYDKWIPDSADLYRLEMTAHLPGRSPQPLAQVPFPVLRAMQEQIPQVKAVTHVVPELMSVHVDGRDFRETASVVDSNFLRLIRLPLVEGDAGVVLVQPESAVLSQTLARKLFGNVDPVGKILTVTPDQHPACAAAPTGSNATSCPPTAYPLTVTGVLRDLPHNTQLVADLLIPNTSRADVLSQSDKQSWTSTNGNYGYVELARHADRTRILAELERMIDRYFNPRDIGINLRASEVVEFRLTPFQDVHLTSDNYGGMKPGGSWTALSGLTGIAALIVLAACFNFMNLATARATLRAREIALRKISGARRQQLVTQFLGEALMMALISLAIALSLVEVLLPPFDRFVGEPIELHYLTDWTLILSIVLGALVVGLISGFYPAMVLSGFRPLTALKAGVSAKSGSGLLRAVLVVTQFSISIGLGVAAVVVFSEIDFARRLDLGFHRDGVVVIRGIAGLTPSARDSLAHALATDPGVISTAYSNAVPFSASGTANVLVRLPGETQSLTSQVINIDPQYPALYGMKLLAGRLLSASRGEDISTRVAGRNMLINAAGARRLGLTPQQAIGKTIDVTDFHTATIVGVLSDVKFTGARDAVQPTLYYFDTTDPHALTVLSVRMRTETAAQTLSHIDATWRMFSDAAIDRYFLSDAYDTLFDSDERQGQILALFVTVAIAISCLGLFGLVVFTAERRTKEIAVRKICGARTTNIVRLVLWRISIPVLIATVIASPFAYAYLEHWLEGYAYRITLSPLYFLAAGGLALLIAWATVFAHALRVARASPVNSMRYE